MSLFPTRSILLLAAVALFAASCGSDSGSASAGVASLADVADTQTDLDEEELSPEDAALAYSECIRNEGVDFPDIGVDADGDIDLRDAFQSAGIDPRSEEFQAAREVCQPLLEGIGFGGGGGRAALGDNPELADAFVEYSDCIRDQGFDVGDLTLGGGPGAGGATPPADGEPPQRGQGQGQGGFGDPSARFAQQLGLDIDDPAVVDALDQCSPIIEAAFSAAGFGPAE